MPFPPTALLDNFVRANGVTLGSNWGTSWLPGHTSFAILSNSGSRQTAFDSNYWNGFRSVNQEMWMTLTAMPVGGPVRVAVRIQPEFLRAYSASIESDGSGFFGPTGNEGSASLGGAGTFAAGDKVGMRIIESSTEIWRWRAGTWTLLSTQSSNLIPGSGYVGLESENISSFTFNDFGGGIPPGAGDTPGYDSGRGSC